MRKILLWKNVLEDFEFWSKNDLKLLKNVAELFSAISKDPFMGLETASSKSRFKSYWSRRINEEHRIVYTVTDAVVLIIACRSHYKV